MTPADRPLPDADARRTIAEELDQNLFVEAAAGTGKTTALVGRLVSVIREGHGTLDRIVAVTFTEKAAGEMKLRLREGIESCRQDPGIPAEQRERLEAALEQLELARIQTIHGFCADLLRERPLEAGVDPLFEMAAEDEADRLLDRAFDDWFERALGDPPEGVRRLLRQGPASRRPPRLSGEAARGPRQRLREAAWKLVQHRDFDAAWKRDGSFDREAALDECVSRLRDVAALADRALRKNDYLARHLRRLGRRLDELEALERVRGGRDHDYLESTLYRWLKDREIKWNWKGYTSAWPPDLPRDEVLARRDAARAFAEETLAAASADLAACLHEELRPVVEAYEELKRREGRLDFLDLLIRTRDLLVANDRIRAHYQARFSHFFVDEFQDTDPLQAEILLLLCADDPEERDFRKVRPAPGKLFLVGDPKQSIYRFRRADVMLYEQVKRRLAASGTKVLQLTTSFRSQPRIQDAVNGAFERRMTGSEDGSQAEYVALEPFREDLADQPAVIALPVPRPYGLYGIYKRAIEDSLPDAVGAFVHWLVEESGWKVTERGGEAAEPVPVEPRHVCLLFRRFQSWGDDVTRPYVRAIEARGVPHVLVGGRSFFDREEVLAVRNALAAIEWPDDTLSVYAALRGPLFALADADLLAFRHRVGALHPLRPFGDHDDAEAMKVARVLPELREVAEALAILGRLHRQRNRRPIADTIARLLAAVRGHAGIAIWPTGEQALANVLRLADRAREFERRGAPSFRAFLEQLELEAERGQAEEAPIVEEGTEGVRMMTVHKAKGLEFPVVILADMTCNATPQTPSRHVDPERRLWAEPLCGAAPLDVLENREVEWVREQDESDRLAYVAATRARDLLVVPAIGDGPEVRPSGSAAHRSGSDPIPEWWLDALDPALYPPAGARAAATSKSPPGCPKFGAEATLTRPNPDDPAPDTAVVPGLQAAEGGSEVVWWDQASLELDVEPGVGQRQQQLLEVDETEQPTLTAEEGIALHRAWAEARVRALDAGKKPELEVVTVTALAAEAIEGREADGGTPCAERPSGKIEVEVIRVPRPPGEDRPAGRRFGELVHRTLAAVRLDADAEQVRTVAQAEARLVGASDEELEAAVGAVARALEHPALRRAAKARREDLRRETPIFQELEDGTLLEGVLDLAYRETDEHGDSVWHVLDFKTDREVERGREAYEEQVRQYVRAVGEATGEPARGVLVQV